MIFYSKEANAFYDSNINTNIPTDKVQVTAEQHQELLAAINSGCIIFDDLSYSKPKPSFFHYFDYETKKWSLNKEEKLKHDIEQNELTIAKLMNEVVNQISLLQDGVDLKMSLDGDEEKLKEWKKYRILLSRVNVSVEKMNLPEKPAL